MAQDRPTEYHPGLEMFKNAVLAQDVAPGDPDFRRMAVLPCADAPHSVIPFTVDLTRVDKHMAKAARDFAEAAVGDNPKWTKEQRQQARGRKAELTYRKLNELQQAAQNWMPSMDPQQQQAQQQQPFNLVQAGDPWAPAPSPYPPPPNTGSMVPSPPPIYMPPGYGAPTSGFGMMAPPTAPTMLPPLPPATNGYPPPPPVGYAPPLGLPAQAPIPQRLPNFPNTFAAQAPRPSAPAQAVQPPRQKVTFGLPGIGPFEQHYHAALVQRSGLYLVLDNRYEGANAFLADQLEGPFPVRIDGHPQDYVVESTGFVLNLFHWTVSVLLVTETHPHHG